MLVCPLIAQIQFDIVLISSILEGMRRQGGRSPTLLCSMSVYQQIDHDTLGQIQFDDDNGGNELIFHNQIAWIQIIDDFKFASFSIASKRLVTNGRSMFNVGHDFPASILIGYLTSRSQRNYASRERIGRGLVNLALLEAQTLSLSPSLSVGHEDPTWIYPTPISPRKKSDFITLLIQKFKLFKYVKNSSYLNERNAFVSSNYIQMLATHQI